MLILRHAWLNLWDKHMTTGRINQVTIFAGRGRRPKPASAVLEPRSAPHLHSPLRRGRSRPPVSFNLKKKKKTTDWTRPPSNYFYNQRGASIKKKLGGSAKITTSAPQPPQIFIHCRTPGEPKPHRTGLTFIKHHTPEKQKSEEGDRHGLHISAAPHKRIRTNAQRRLKHHPSPRPRASQREGLPLGKPSGSTLPRPNRECRSRVEHPEEGALEVQYYRLGRDHNKPTTLKKIRGGCGAHIRSTNPGVRTTQLTSLSTVAHPWIPLRRPQDTAQSSGKQTQRREPHAPDPGR